MPFPGRALRREPVLDRAPHLYRRGGFSGRVPRRKRDRTPQGLAGQSRRCRHRSGKRSSTSGRRVHRVDDGWIGEGASARAALPPHSPWTICGSATRPSESMRCIGITSAYVESRQDAPRIPSLALCARRRQRTTPPVASGSPSFSGWCEAGPVSRSSNRSTIVADLARVASVDLERSGNGVVVEVADDRVGGAPAWACAASADCVAAPDRPARAGQPARRRDATAALSPWRRPPAGTSRSCARPPASAARRGRPRVSVARALASSVE